MSQSQVPSQTQTQLIQYKDCLLVSRHALLTTQEEDLHKICQKITKVDSLPTDPIELRKLIDYYDAVVGVIPLIFQVQLLQMKKAVLLFYMESVGTAKSKAESEELLKKSGMEGVILPPAKEGEPYRVSIYRGIVMIKEIKIEQDFITKH
jgi:hypothetical protein